jgi:hypothetical protein
MNNALCQLSQYGQAYWIDNLTRSMITSGALNTRVAEYGLRGVTSNPAIFHKAIPGSNEYDAQIQQLVHEGLAIPDIYKQLIVTDIQDACDILRSVYDATDRMDGYVSLEVSPYLAHDTAGTMQEVRRLWHAVDRPNVFIKIPGTAAGVPAIEEMLYEGININITLLFSVVTAAFKGLDSRQFGRRLFAPDPFLWTSDAQQVEAIRQQLGWLHSLEAFRGKATAITQFATAIKEARFSHVVLLAMGGLSLFPRVCRDIFGVAPGWPQLLVLDNTDPAAIRQVETCVDSARTLFIIASKSGTSDETLTLFRDVHDRLKPQMAGKVNDHVVAITDPGTPLAAEARRQGFRYCFENPVDIGGRYSALSYFGLVPMALLGRVGLASPHRSV